MELAFRKKGKVIQETIYFIQYKDEEYEVAHENRKIYAPFPVIHIIGRKVYSKARRFLYENKNFSGGILLTKDNKYTLAIESSLFLINTPIPKEWRLKNPQKEIHNPLDLKLRKEMLRSYIVSLLEKAGKKNIAGFCKIAEFKVEKGFSNEEATFSLNGQNITFYPMDMRPCIPDWNAGIKFHRNYMMHYIKNEFNQELPFSKYF